MWSTFAVRRMFWSRYWNAIFLASVGTRLCSLEDDMESFGPLWGESLLFPQCWEGCTLHSLQRKEISRKLSWSICWNECVNILADSKINHSRIISLIRYGWRSFVFTFGDIERGKAVLHGKCNRAGRWRGNFLSEEESHGLSLHVSIEQ